MHRTLWHAKRFAYIDWLAYKFLQKMKTKLGSSSSLTKLESEVTHIVLSLQVIDDLFHRYESRAATRAFFLLADLLMCEEVAVLDHCATTVEALCTDTGLLSRMQMVAWGGGAWTGIFLTLLAMNCSTGTLRIGSAGIGPQPIGHLSCLFVFMLV